MAKLQVGIVGLGRFGLTFAQALVRQGAEVLAIDQSETVVQAARDLLPHVYVADGTDEKALAQLGFADFSHVLVSVGESVTSSAMVALHVKDLGVPVVWAKAISDDHARLLTRIGVDKTVFPERYAANELASRLMVPGLINQLPIGDGAEDVAVLELVVDHWREKTLRELDLSKKHQTVVVAKREFGEDRYRFAPGADVPLRLGDKLVVIGPRKVVVGLEA